MDEVAKDQKEKALRFLNLCSGRFGSEPKADHQIAAELGFESPAMLYKQLELDGSPVCGVCGQLYPSPEHREEHKGKPKKRQTTLGSGRRVRLPNARDAESLFHEALEQLKLSVYFVGFEEGWLEGNVEEGQFKGKHFITHFVDRDSSEIAWREEFTEEEWRELCERHGTDPSRDQVTLSVGEVGPEGGVGRAPSERLTALIAVYVLAGQSLTPLIEALHYEPDSADGEKLNAKVDELQEAAKHLAARVRGGVVERGKGVTEFTLEEHFAAWLIRDLNKEGVTSDEEVHEQLKKRFAGYLDRLTLEEISRLRGLGLGPPE
jgi:hypothetical protein